MCTASCIHTTDHVDVHQISVQWTLLYNPAIVKQHLCETSMMSMEHQLTDCLVYRMLIHKLNWQLKWLTVYFNKWPRGAAIHSPTQDIQKIECGQIYQIYWTKKETLHTFFHKFQLKNIIFRYCYVFRSLVFFLSFSRYCTRSCLTIMAGVGVAHKLLKKTKKKTRKR